jgi:hypothetical protein
MQIDYSNDWEDGTKTEYTCDINKNLVKKIEYVWNNTSNYWEEYYSDEYMYDSNNKLIMTIQNYSLMAYPRKTEYIYDINGTLIKEIDYNEEEKNIWKIYSKIEYERNADTVKKIIYDWKYNIWKKIIKKEYIYNNAGKEIMLIFYSWDNTNNDWMIGEKYEYMYDSNGNKTMETYYKHNIEGDNFKLISKTEYIYDLSYSIKNLIFPYYYYLYFETNNMLIEMKEYRWKSNNWKCYHEKFYYSPQK